MEMWVSRHITGQAPAPTPRVACGSLLGGLWGPGSREQALQVQTMCTLAQLQEPSSGVESGWQ